MFRYRLKQLLAVGRRGQQFGDRNREKPSAEFQFGPAMHVCQEAVMADSLKAGREGVEQQTTDEFAGLQGHGLRFLTLFISIVLPLESYRIVIH